MGAASPPILITAEEINCLLHGYLMDSGFQHAAFCLRTEGRLEQSAHFRTFVRRGALVDLLSKALLYAEVEAHWRADAVTTACAQPFSLLAPHACAADARAQPLPVAERLKEALDAAPARDAASVAAGKRKAVAVDDGASAKRPRTDGDPDRMDTAPEGPPAPAPAPAQAPAPPPAPAAEAGPSKPASKPIPKPPLKPLATAPAKTAAPALKTPTPVAGNMPPPATIPATAAAQPLVKRDPWAIRRCDGHTAEVFVCAWNHANPDVFASGDKMAGVNIWNLPPTPPNADAAGPPGALAPAYMRTLSMSDMPDLTALDWSADGALLSVASYDNALRVLTADGREYMTHDMHKGPIFATRFSRDCKWLVTASLDGTACVWDVPGKRLEMLYKCHLDCCLDCDWLDNEIFATSGADKLVNLMRVGDQKPLKTFSGHTNEVNQVRFHAQRQLLATCSDDRTARIWSLKDILARARGGVPTPSGSGGAAAAEDSPLVLRGHKNNVSTVDWCPAQPGGALLLATTSFDGTTRVWDGATGACLRTFADHKTPVFAVAFSPDGRWLATGGGDGFLFVYDVAKREKRWTWDAGEVDDADERAPTRTKGIFEIDWQQVDGRNRMAVSLESKHVAVVDVRRVPELNP